MPSNIPSMRNLMEDPLFRAYMKTTPRRQHAHTSGHPWQLWVGTEDGRWLTRTYASYKEVWPVFVNRFKLHAQDPTIVSRRVFYAPPGEWYKVKVKRNRRPTPDDKSTFRWQVENRWRQKFFWPEIDLHWCGRCRRPVYWMPLFETHHALRRQPAIASDDNYRCLICGVRWVTTPTIDQMVKMEVP